MISIAMQTRTCTLIRASVCRKSTFMPFTSSRGIHLVESLRLQDAKAATSCPQRSLSILGVNGVDLEHIGRPFTTYNHFRCNACQEMSIFDDTALTLVTPTDVPSRTKVDFAGI